MAKRINIIFVGIVFLAIPFFAKAAYIGQKVNFFVDSAYDLDQREQVSATLQKETDLLYFYTDDSWWNSLSFDRQNETYRILDSLAKEFETKIYPTLTKAFGSEWKPGIDKDSKITVLVHLMPEGAGGYFNTRDEYPAIQAPNSNEREMVYLNMQYIDTPSAKSLLAHELVHLIEFAQKEKKYGVEEEIWLDEGRAEYAPTLLGYDNEYQDSNLQARVENFISKPYDSLTEWRNEKYDYGVLNLFIQYLIDHYGKEILVDSLHSPEKGIPSLNYALEKNGFKENFSQIFTDWTIAVLVNDCSIGERYCYKNQNLKDLRVTPLTIFLPLVAGTTLSVPYATQDWAGNWHRLVGGRGTLKLQFKGDPQADFKVPYTNCSSDKCAVGFISLNENQEGSLILPGLGTKYTSLTIIPSIQTKISGFDGSEPFYQFSWEVKTLKESESEIRESLLAQVETLEKEIAKIKAEIETILTERQKLASDREKIGTQKENKFPTGQAGPISCQKFENDLYYGMMANTEVYCLQEFLKNKGNDIYPDGLITGNFLDLTKSAIIRYQEKHADEILKPLGLNGGTGYFGPLTRAVANQEFKTSEVD